MTIRQPVIGPNSHWESCRAVPLVCRQQPHEATFHILPYGVEGRKLRMVENPSVIAKGNEKSSDVFFLKMAREVTDEAFAQFDIRDKQQGTYDVSGECAKEFTAGELIIDGIDTKSIQCIVRFKVRIFRPR